MEVFLTTLVLGVALIFNFLNLKRLLIILVFVSPFSGFSAINISGIYFLAFSISALLILTSFIFLSSLNLSSVAQINLKDKTVIWSVVLVMASIIGAINSGFINGYDYYWGTNLDSLKANPLRLSNLHLLQIIFLFLGLFSTFFISQFIKTKEITFLFLKVFFLSGFVMCGIGFLELFSFFLNFELPLLYHTVPTGEIGMSKSGARIDGLIGIPRINSFAYETSNFAHHIALQYAILFYFNKYGCHIFSKFFDQILKIIFFLALIFCISTTAMIAIVLIHSLGFFINQPILKASLKFIFFAFLLFLIGYFFYLFIPIVQLALDSFLLEKFLQGSAQERIQVATNSYDIFIAYPFFGVGLGIIPPSDLLLQLLAGIGIFGTGIFIFLLAFILKKGTTRIYFEKFQTKPNLLKLSYLLRSLALGLIVSLVLYQGVGFNFRFGDFWVLIGIITGIQNILEDQLQHV